MSVSFSDLSGKVRGANASGGGTIAHNASTLEFTNVRVNLGGTSLALDGQVNERLNLRFALNTQDLSLLAAESRGQLKASGTVTGTLANPAVVASAHGHDIDYQGIKIAALEANINFDPAATERESHVELGVHKLSYKTRTLDAATFTLQGLPSAYAVHLSASAPGLAVNIQARGAYASPELQGTADRACLNGNDALHLALERPVDLLVSPAHVRVEWLCLAGTPGSICADGDWTPAAWSTTATTNELPLATLTAGMTPSVQYLGTGSAHLRLSGGAALPTVGTLRAQLTDAEIAHRLASKKVSRTRIGSGTAGHQRDARHGQRAVRPGRWPGRHHEREARHPAVHARAGRTCPSAASCTRTARTAAWSRSTCRRSTAPPASSPLTSASPAPWARRAFRG